MKYIISENELIDYTSKVIEDGGKSLIGTLYKDFLKTKQPVELVEEGREIGISSRIDWFVCFKVIQKVKEDKCQ